MSIVLVGINHKTAPIEVRELLAFSDESCSEGLRALVDGEIVREGLIVSTCNRVEVVTATPRNQLQEGVERIAGPHCYQFYAGTADFTAMMEAEPGTLFLTDYLARHFDRIIMQGLGIDRHPELRDDYFGNYSRVVYLAQTRDPELERIAEAAARRLQLAYEYRFTGYGEMQGFLAAARGAA